MAKQALIYERPVPVSKQRHSNWAVGKTTDYGFARGLNAVPLVTQEFAVAGREYPIVFTKSGEGYVASALLGLRDAENLFVDNAGKWVGTYVPAFFRRYPFVFAVEEKDNRMTLCIDDDYPGLNGDGKGERMFDEAP